jgi:hypothetical protein
MALIHVIIISYMALGLGVQIKGRYKIGLGLEDAPPSLGRALRDYAPVLFIVPATWSFAAFRRWRKYGTDLPESASMMISGISVACVLLFLAFLGTISVWSQGSLLQAPSPRGENG